MALKAAILTAATDDQIIVLTLCMAALDGTLTGMVLNPPADVTPYQLDQARPLIVRELYRRGLSVITALAAL